MANTTEFENGFRDDLKGIPSIAFTQANPNVYLRAYINPSTFEKLRKVERAYDKEWADFEKAAVNSRPYRIASEILSITEDRMKLNHTPRPPSWADNGRGGPYDPRTIYEQAKTRIDGADQAYQSHLQENREITKEAVIADIEKQPLQKQFNQPTSISQREESMTDILRAFEQLEANITQHIQNSHSYRTELSKWYFDNRMALMKEQEQMGVTDPHNAVQSIQRARIEEIPNSAEKEVLEFLNQFKSEHLRGRGFDQAVEPKPDLTPPTMNGASGEQNDQHLKPPEFENKNMKGAAHRRNADIRQKHLGEAPQAPQDNQNSNGRDASLEPPTMPRGFGFNNERNS